MYKSKIENNISIDKDDTNKPLGLIESRYLQISKEDNNKSTDIIKINNKNIKVDVIDIDKDKEIKENNFINSRRSNFNNYNKNIMAWKNKREEKYKVQLNNYLL